MLATKLHKRIPLLLLLIIFGMSTVHAQKDTTKTTTTTNDVDIKLLVQWENDDFNIILIFHIAKL